MANINPNQQKSISQNKMILAYLQQGNSLTGLEAFTLFQCRYLNSRIPEIKKMGYEIEDEFITVPSGKKVKRYWLKQA